MLKTINESLFYRKTSPAKTYLNPNFILNIVVIILAYLLIAELIFNATYISIRVEGQSMHPTLIGADGPNDSGDYIYINTKISPTYGDIVVVEVSDESTGTNYNIIKRVVAFGGDAVKMEAGQLYIKRSGEQDFTAVEESYVVHCDPNLMKNSFIEHVVEEGKMFLLGDNRDDSVDSRAHGDFSVENLIGVAPSWALKNKGIITSVFTFFKFTLPGALGLKRG